MKPKRNLLVPALLAIIIVMMVQNYFLVRKYNKQVEHSRKVSDELTKMEVMKEGDRVSTFVAMHFDGSTHEFNPTVGARNRFLFVFTASCNACVKNIPQSNRIVTDLVQVNVDVIGLSTDSLFKIKNLRQQVPFTFPVMSIAGDSTTILLYKLRTFPQTILLDTAGTVTRLWTGLFGEERRESVVSEVRQLSVATWRKESHDARGD